MKSICIFVPNYNSFMQSYTDKIVSALKVNNEVIVYGVKTNIVKSDNVDVVIDEDLEYLFKNNDPRIYENLLNFLNQRKIEKLFIPRLSHPEYFFSEIRIREIQFKIVLSIFSFELLSKSRARRELVVDLICLTSIDKVIVHSILGKYLNYPFEYRSSEVQNKLFFVPEPIYETKEEYEVCTVNSSPNNKIPSILYFGNMFYGKGVDLLLAASSLVKKKMRIVIAGDFGNKNFSSPFLNYEKYSNVEVIDKYIERDQMVKLFTDCDAVVLPYRKTYKHGTSGVFVQSLLANKPLLVPNFYPFDYAVEFYSCGITFNAEDLKDLAMRLDDISEMIDGRFKNGIDSYKNDLISWSDLARLILK